MEPHRNRGKTGPSGRTGERGTASVEAVVALPVLLLLFVSVFYVRDNSLALQSAANQARTCAWLYSAANCPEDRSALPAACEGIVPEVDLDDAEDPPLLPPIPDPIDDVLEPMLRPILEAAFGRAVTAKAEKSFDPPKVYGSERKVVHRNYHLACNIQRKELKDVINDVWTDISDDIF